LLHRETVGTSALAGGLVYLLLTKLSINELAVAIVSGLVVVLVREISIRFNLNLPKVVSK
jgi:uncharacterized membrane protein YeiH